ncbi:MAG: hypothetical protein ACK5LK_00800 [Chthoniobacterales bacterium]
MESVLMGQSERAVTFCVKRYKILDNRGSPLVVVNDNHQSLTRHRLPKTLNTSELTIRIHETWGAPAALFGIRCYG